MMLLFVAKSLFLEIFGKVLYSLNSDRTKLTVENGINYMGRGSYNLDRFNIFFDLCNLSSPICIGWEEAELNDQNRFPNSSFGLSQSPKLESESDSRICCLYLEMKKEYKKNIDENKIPYLHARKKDYL